MLHHDVVIVGGGCVGLSVAWHLAKESTMSIAVLEKEHHLAAHQSGRNSGVLHPGFNYTPGSAKARFATEGTARLKDYCHQHQIPCEELGVMVVAQTPQEVDRLEDLADQAEANGVAYELLRSEAAIQEREPFAVGEAALFASEAASIDPQQYVYQLAKDAQAAGVKLYTGHGVESISMIADGYRLVTRGGDHKASYLVNAAGQHADEIAHQVGVGGGYRIIPFRGEYYELVPERTDLCRTMIYPTPDPDLPFLGVHYTRRTDGKVIVGPNAVLAFGREAYSNRQVNLKDLIQTVTYPGFLKLIASWDMVAVALDELHKSYRKRRFVAASQRLVPDVTSEDLRKSYSGIRAQLVDESGRLVKQPMSIETSNGIHVLNAVSPGLTCSLPYGQHIANKLVGMAD